MLYLVTDVIKVTNAQFLVKTSVIQNNGSDSKHEPFLDT